MSYTDLLKKKAILLDVDAGDGDRILEVLADGLCNLDPELVPRRGELLDALRERETLGSTAAHMVAIPHVKLPGVKKVSIVVAVHQAGVDFRALDGELVHVFFSVVRPEESADEHLAILRWIADIAQHQDFVPFARQATEPSHIIDLLAEFSPA
ncbi:MAG TPA: PTS sugar transporter subunit IIA [Planctomycetota bacterium]